MTESGAPRVLVVNAGSSSLKLSVVGTDGSVSDQCEIDSWDGTPDAPALTSYFGQLATPDAIGHRVVHGGAIFTAPALIDDGVLGQIDSLTSLAPLHQPRALAGIAATAAAFPGLPQVACFDTAFHATLPAAASAYALPGAWRDRFGLRKFGFHGLSHSYASRRAAELTHNADREQFRVVTCHLGAGSSLAAVQGGRSVETTMGFTPVDGLVMATRSGSVDPGLLTWLASDGRVPLAELADALEHRSGLAGLAGGTGDMRQVESAARGGDQRAVLALEVHAHRLVAAIASMAAAMNGLDALAFTGGIGEHDPRVRSAAAAGLGFIGVTIDSGANESARSDADISAAGAMVRTLVLTAREDIEIARGVRQALHSASGRPGRAWSVP